MSANHSLLALLRVLLPLAAEWVQSQEREILQQGTALTPDQIKDARNAGVRFPEKIRLQVIEAIPLPSDPRLEHFRFK